MDLLVKEKLSAQEQENYGSEIQTKLRIRMQKNYKFANEDADHDGEMPLCGSRTATSVECMPAGWPRPAPNTLEVLCGEIECIGTAGHGPALFESLKGY